jgi:hypothetical protein
MGHKMTLLSFQLPQKQELTPVGITVDNEETELINRFIVKLIYIKAGPCSAFVFWANAVYFVCHLQAGPATTL